MTQWDYYVLHVQQSEEMILYSPTPNTYFEKVTGPLTFSILERMGSDGWELVTKEPKDYIFKRPRQIMTDKAPAVEI